MKQSCFIKHTCKKAMVVEIEMKIVSKDSLSFPKRTEC